MHKLKYFIIPLILGIIIASCEKDDTSVIDPILTFPAITSHYIMPTALNSDTVNCIAGATVQSEEQISSVTVKFYDFGNTVLIQADLKDDGVYPDTTAGDNKYTGIVFYNFPCRQVGAHNVEFIATNISGLNSPILQENVTVIRNPNLPPLISELSILPDSLQAGDTAFFTFETKAIDPNGECDILRVFYTGFAPDGSSLTPRDLYDDGSCCILPPFNTTSGDVTANDSRFTRKFLGFTSQLGYFRYSIKAVDRSFDTSNVLTDSIHIY